MLALRRPVQRQIQGSLRTPHRCGGHGQAGGAEPVVHQVKALALLAQQLAFMHNTIIKKQFALMIAAMRHTMRPAPHGEAGCAHIHQKGRNQRLFAAFCLLNAGSRKKNDKIGLIRMADEVFGTIDHISIAALFGAGFHRANIGARPRLGHGQTIMPLALDGRDEITLDLLSRTALQNIGRTAHAHLQGIARTAKLTLHQGEAQSIQPAAAKFLRHIGRIKPQLNGFALNVLRDFGGHIVQLFHKVFMRIKLSLAKAAHHVHQHLLFFGNRKAHEFALRLRPRVVPTIG